MLIIQRVNKLTKGFSLIELLIVISIIGLLSAALMANFMGARERARDSKKIEDMNQIKNALRMYYNDNQSYPDETGGHKLDPSNITKYMPGAAGIDYSYDYYPSSDLDGFNLCVDLDAGSGDDDINSQLRCGQSELNSVCGLAVGIGNTKDKLYVVCAN